MKDRILKFLNNKQLSATKLADNIGVQRSSISHILSGRNKPSFDFIEKILVSYPELNAQWLITGKGEMYLHQKTLFDQEAPASDTTQNLTPRESNIQNNKKPLEDLYKTEEGKTKQVTIERIIIFYTNGKFKEYKP